MKKTLLIALAGIMMFAFTQCGGGQNSKGNTGDTDDTQTTVDDEVDDDDIDLSEYTEEFRDNYALYEKIMDHVSNAESCEDLEGVIWVIFGEAMSLSEKEYADDEQMTEEEEEYLNEIGEEFSKLMEQKQEELGCEDEENGDDDSLNFGDFEDGDDWDSWADDEDEDDDDWNIDDDE